MKKSLFTLLILASAFVLRAQEKPHVLDLQQCIDIAVENNLSVRRSLLQKEGARIGLTQSKAELLPSVNLGGAYGYNWGRSIDPTTNDFINQQINYSSVNGNASMTLFSWFRLINTVKQNKLTLEAANYDVQNVRNNISLDIVTFYLNVIFNRELLENARYQLESSEEQLDRTKKLVQGGALPRTSELELVSQVATNEVNVINAENNLNLALLNLKQAMLMPVSQEIELMVPEVDVEEPGLDQNVTEIYLAALENMPEIKSNELQVESAVMGVKVAEAGYAPRLSLNGNFSTNYSDAFKTFIPDENNPVVINRDQNGNIITTPTFFQTIDGTAIEQISVSPNGSTETIKFGDQLDGNLSRSLSLNLSIPIFNNLQVKSSVQRAKIDLQMAEIALMEQRNFLRQTIEAAYNDAQAAAKTYSASLRQVEALEETFRSMENQYNLGAANFTDYQVSNNNLFGARTDLTRAKFDYIFKNKILDFYQGKPLTF